MKKVLLSTLALSMLTASAFAADPTPTPVQGGGGVVRFQGTIVAGACGIDAGSLDQTVLLGSVSNKQFKQKGDQSDAKTFQIKLTDCDTSTTKNAYFTFTGTGDAIDNTLFATTGGAKNVALRLQAASGENVVNGQMQSSATVLSNTATNVVNFSAMYVATAAGVTPGTADSVVNFSVSYN